MDTIVKKRTLPRAVNVPHEILTSKQIIDDSFKIIPANKQVKKDIIYDIFNLIALTLMALMISPIIIIVCLYFAGSWLIEHIKISQPLSNEAKQLISTRHY